ncbi:MAG: hypothetical protein WC455_16600 [Dehalococcoidia bacterium]|jgi:hypothetical protein
MSAQPTIESMAATVALAQLTVLMHVDDIRRAQTLATIQRPDNP